MQFIYLRTFRGSLDVRDAIILTVIYVPISMYRYKRACKIINAKIISYAFTGTQNNL